MIQKYLQQTGNTGKNIVEGTYTISDPYHGQMEFNWKEKFVWGALNLADTSLRSKYLKLFQDGLKNKK